MDKLLIRGGKALKGEMIVSGAKNAALPELCAALLTADAVTLRNVPKLQDISTMAKLIRHMGVEVQQPEDGVMRLCAQRLEQPEAPYDLVKTMRASVLALVALVFTFPLWFVPFFAVLGPPIIWGWLTYRVMTFDTLADLASPDERQALLRQHRVPLLLMGVACGYLGAAPAALWALGALTLVLAPLVLVASVWLYTLVFVFSSLWFAHYLLAALATLRATPLPGVEAPSSNLTQLTSP